MLKTSTKNAQCAAITDISTFTNSILKCVSLEDVFSSFSRLGRSTHALTEERSNDLIF